MNSQCMKRRVYVGEKCLEKVGIDDGLLAKLDFLFHSSGVIALCSNSVSVEPGEPAMLMMLRNRMFLLSADSVFLKAGKPARYTAWRLYEVSWLNNIEISDYTKRNELFSVHQVNICPNEIKKPLKP